MMNNCMMMENIEGRDFPCFVFVFTSTPVRSTFAVRGSSVDCIAIGVFPSASPQELSCDIHPLLRCSVSSLNWFVCAFSCRECMRLLFGYHHHWRHTRSSRTSQNNGLPGMLIFWSSIIHISAIGGSNDLQHWFILVDDVFIASRWYNT